MKTWIEVGEKVICFDIPLAVHERTFENFCDFKTAKAKHLDGDEHGISPASLIEILSTMVDGPLQELPIIEKDASVAEMIESNYTIGMEDEITLWGLYAHIINIIKSYTPDFVPETFTLNFAGNNFRVTQRRVYVDMLNRPYTTGETIEALEYQRRAAHNIEQTPHDEGNIDFNLGLTEFAILVRKEGEALPSDRRKLDSFIEQRKRLFRHLPLNYVLDLRFFFINSLLFYSPTSDLSSSGKARRASSPPRKQRWIRKGK